MCLSDTAVSPPTLSQLVLCVALVGGSTADASESRKRKSTLAGSSLSAACALSARPVDPQIALSYPLLLPKTARVDLQGGAAATKPYPVLPLPSNDIPEPLPVDSYPPQRRCCGTGSRCCTEGETTCACCPLPEDADLLLSLSSVDVSNAASTRCCIVPCHGPPVIVRNLQTRGENAWEGGE